MMQETYRFLRQSRHIIEKSPNQVYTSALLFLPQSSWARENYQNRVPKWIKLTARLSYTWDACLETLLGHSARVEKITFTSDGTLLASKSKDCTQLWETDTGKCRGMLRHDSGSDHLVFSPDNRVLVTGLDRSLELLDTTTGSRQSSLVGHQSGIRRCLFAPNSQILASADDVSVGLWNVSTGLSHSIFEFQGKTFKAMDFSHDSKLIVVAFGSDIQVRDVETSNIVAIFREHYHNVNSVEFSPDSPLVLSTCYRSIWLWNHPIPKPRKKLKGLIGNVRSAKFSPDGSIIASVHESQMCVTLWDTSTGNRFQVLPVSIDNLSVYCGTIFSPDSRVLVTPLTRCAKSWDTTTGEETATFEYNKEIIGDSTDISKCSKNGKLFAQTMGSKMAIWEVATGVLLRTFEVQSRKVRDLAISPVGDLIAASDYNTAKLWSLNESPTNQATIRNGTRWILCVTVSLDGTLAASSLSSEEGIRLWDLESGSSRTIATESYDKPFYLAISPDNSLLAMQGSSTVLVWEIENGSVLYNTRSGIDNTTRISFSSDSRLLKIDSYKQKAQLVEIHARESKDVQKPSHAESTRSQHSPDGRFFLGLGPNLRTTCLWGRQKGTGQAILKFELGGACGVATFSPDSRFIAFVSNERFICVWETETGVRLGVHAEALACIGVVLFSHDSRFIAYTFGGEKCLRLLPLRNGLSRKWALVYESPLNLVTFSPDASIIAAISGSAILLCETTSGSVARKLEFDQKRVSHITFLPNRDILIAGHEDGTIRSWDTKSDALLHTLSLKDCPPRFTLDSKGKFLWAMDEGLFLDKVLRPCEKPAVSLEDDQWVLFNGERVFWLPPEFRPALSFTCASSNKSLVASNTFGEMTCIYFDI